MNTCRLQWTTVGVFTVHSKKKPQLFQASGLLVQICPEMQVSEMRKHHKASQSILIPKKSPKHSHIILSNMEQYENDTLWYLIMKGIESH